MHLIDSAGANEGLLHNMSNDKYFLIRRPGSWTPLAEYFVIIGYSTNPQKGGAGCGKIQQRFPTKDWQDFPFKDNIEDFCQPAGWMLSNERQEPKFFPFVLSDQIGNRQHCGCLSFYEPVAITPTKPIDEEEETDNGADSLTRSFSIVGSASVHHTIMYAPKALVIISRLQYTEAFRQCLGTIYTVHLERLDVSLETLVGNLLGHVYVPPPGGPQVRFSIGGGDRQALQSPMNSSIPVTNSCVAQLFQLLGINNALILFCAVMTEHKIIFHSKSITRLNDACHALKSLMYPFEFNHTYVPHLPASTLDVCESPTPFIYGVHSSLKDECSGLIDVIIADLDGGSIAVPDGTSIPTLPEALWTTVKDQLAMVLHPELNSADFAFPPLALKPSVQFQVDKEVRAIFLRMFALLFQGYRSCLVIIRIHPKPVIKLHKGRFLCQQGLIGDEFVGRLLDCMFFGDFMRDRGCPWRPCDIWDEVHKALPDQLRAEANDPKLVMVNIQEIAQQLALNENPNSQPYVPKIIKPPEGAHTRIHAPAFPTLNSALIEDIMQEEMSKQRLPSYSSIPKHNQPRIVPTGSKVVDIFEKRTQLMDNSARRLEVLRHCINCIFENKISDARKSIHAVIRALKSHAAKLVLCHELSHHVTGNKAMLESQQFDMVVKLMHCALQDNTKMDDYGVAAAMLPLATSFCRKLCTGVIQFAYTTIQDHPVWKNQQFWESAFYSDAQKEIKSLYMPRVESSLSSVHNNNYSLISHSHPEKRNDHHNMSCKPSEYTALEIAAEQLRLPLDNETINEFANREESTIYSQAIHYANRMVYLLVPLDVPSRRRKEINYVEEERMSNMTSVAESDSVEAASALLEDKDPVIECRTSVVRFVNKFVDHVCNEGGVTKGHKEALEAMIPGVVDMHMETLEAVIRESKRLPKVQKPKIPVPVLLPGEELVMDSLRVYMLPDGRDDSTSGGAAGPILLPAEGAVFITNYRIVFKGSPCDPYACEQVVIRSFPITSLTKEKRITVQYIAHLDQILQEGMQLRSATFQLMKLAFDEEVPSESIELFRKMINKLRHPSNIFQYFAFAEQTVSPPVAPYAMKDKNSTLKGFAKKTILLTAKKVGLKPKQSTKQKYVFRNWAQGNGGTLPASTKYVTSNNSSPNKQLSVNRDNPDGDAVSLGSVGSLSQDVSDDENLHVPLSTAFSATGSDSKSLERIMERSYYKDYKRLGLGSLNKAGSSSTSSSYLSKAESFRISSLNSTYAVCRSYPALVVVPNAISEDNLKKVARCYRGSRFPVITWKHPRTRALLVRGAAFNTKGVMGILRGNQQYAPGGGANEIHTHPEHELYLRAICNCTPLALVKQGSSWGTTDRDSILSDSAFGSSISATSNISLLRSPPSGQSTLGKSKPDSVTPESHRKNSGHRFAKAFAFSTIRNSGGKSYKTYKNWMAPKPRKPVTLETSLNTPAYKSTPMLKGEGFDGSIPEQYIRPKSKAALYIFGKKSQMKGIKPDSHGKIIYIPVDFYEVRHLRASFKKLMRACIPSNLVTDPEAGYLKSVENSEWLPQITCVLDMVKNVVDIIDNQGSSAMLCLEEGWDFTAQVSCLSQLCMDPYYRTIEGFQTLIEKEWLGFGHRFARRNNMTGSDGPSSNTNFAPVFMQFLDIVHQFMRQYPMSFEFNDTYIKFLAFHSISARFRTFLADSELERVEYGFMAQDDKRGSLPRPYKTVDTSSDDKNIYMHSSRHLGGNSQLHNLGQSVFEYIDKNHAKSPTFYNFLYEKDTRTLRPADLIGNLEIWDYYVNENVGTGPAFDLEICHPETNAEEDQTLPGKETRKCITKGVDIINNVIPDAFQHCLNEIYRMETDVGHLPQQWKQHWDKLEIPNNI
ncbi:unnamed protein product [Allacma fusca]|uniref:Myotubularin-related protein 13 n=1 Tax=Allacma fusca TaxID=39272 RepID=A0A8J2L155_9HEXA|nr:unnamed protein product [Allacma fusca]